VAQIGEIVNHTCSSPLLFATKQCEPIYETGKEAEIGDYGEPEEHMFSVGGNESATYLVPLTVTVEDINSRLFGVPCSMQ